MSVVQRGLVRLLIALAVLAALAAAVFVLPGYLAPRSAFSSAGDAVRAQNDVRGLMLQSLGGLVVLVGAYVTWRQFQVSREQLQHNLRATADQLRASQAQLIIAQQGQITGRFTLAVDQLGNEQLVVRLGGIHALERIAKDSPGDASAIAEILASYIRQHAPWSGDGGASSAGSLDPGLPHLVTRAADVQAALTVLTRRAIRPEGDERLRLLGVDLRRANLFAAQLGGADLEGTHMGGAWIRNACLDQADLTRANLCEADLAGASFEDAELTGALLQGAHLEGACLRGAKLDGACLDGAVADPATVWPSGFEPQRAGVVVSPL